ncbi:MAG: hypothetical protein JOZ72_03970 [Alphaproteobacteria bacterium]|nr:hypothetical protein [Alphaproteobacteria bacterium]
MPAFGASSVDFPVDRVIFACRAALAVQPHSSDIKLLFDLARAAKGVGLKVVTVTAHDFVAIAQYFPVSD